MSRHRLEPIRPRYGRILAVLAAVGVTLVAVLGGTGVLPTRGSGAAALSSAIQSPSADPRPEQSGSGQSGSGQAGLREADPGRAEQSRNTDVAGPKEVSDPLVLAADPTLVPADSGEGKRVVFSQIDQRVWLIEEDDTVERTYLVSGSVYDNLQPGSYAVFSRSEEAWGIDDSGTMKWFVRFAHGPNAAIGFHDIPYAGGEPLQSEKELGTPQSHGCIRQRTDDALALWDFAPIGTDVVVI
ncbi:L,D-transpeptidase [Nocardioides sp. Root151]|uniref:L,D-transpeptidase n=1 Tax=Nocardioides sp. Root151 TaxID=1736475 RepID=UPI00070398F4|nr:L,D-transpeptidase [Nocardioides sp. Root151]KQZ75012.1 hypothetical protein ASD66_01135 [Nocardioides sp. Root151]